jgi:hypothetical protein
VSAIGSVRSSLLMSSDTMGADEEGIRADRPTKIVCNRIRQETAALRDFGPAYDGFGSNSVIRQCRLNVRITPESRPERFVMPCRTSATRRHKQCSKGGASYSITSSAVICMISGTVRPSALAVLRLMTSSNFVGCTTGKSPALSPFNILAT